MSLLNIYPPEPPSPPSPRPPPPPPPRPPPPPPRPPPPRPPRPRPPRPPPPRPRPRPRPPLPPASAPSNSPSTLPPDGGMSRATLIELVMGTVLGGTMLIFVGICAFSCKRRKWGRMKRYGLDNDSCAPSQPPKAPSAPVYSSDGGDLERSHPAPTPGIALGLSQSTFSYDELAIATNGFSSLNLLGQGGFGYVHKGVLPNGKTVAVKQLKSGGGQGDREFQAEVEVISRVHHRHLVSLVGYCMAGTQRLLVYEFVPNRTLEFHLHGKDRPTMDWPTRMKIAIGSAKGLAYLHEDCQPKIIHRDIKASNILLGDSFEAKVADFGLARFSLDTDTHVSTRVMGTIGYLAPEYAASGKLTDKSDVFSFGVVLLELITGRKPVDKTQSYPDDSIVEWARPLLSHALKNGNFNPLVDPRLEKNYIPGEMTQMVACAATCVRHTARRRPRMSQVLRALEGNVTLDDLNEGTTPGHSRAFDSLEGSGYDTGQYYEDLNKFRKPALEGQEQSTTSEYSGASM